MQFTIENREIRYDGKIGVRTKISFYGNEYVCILKSIIFNEKMKKYVIHFSNNSRFFDNELTILRKYEYTCEEYGDYYSDTYKIVPMNRYSGDTLIEI